MNLKLYYNPGSCSLASHAALEEAALPYAIEKIDLRAGANDTDAFRARNMWGRVPALEFDGSILTETIAILSFIAGIVPERGFLPRSGSIEHARALEWMALLAGTVHIAFRPLFRPNRLASTPEGQADVGRLGLDSLNATLSLFDRKVGDGPYALGDEFSFVDLHLLVFLLWMQRPVLEGRLGVFPNLDTARARLLARPAVRTAMTQEGLLG